MYKEPFIKIQNYLIKCDEISSIYIENYEKLFDITFIMKHESSINFRFKDITERDNLFDYVESHLNVL